MFPKPKARHLYPPPCVLHEDDHLLVVNKPAGWNTHAPSPYAGPGIYEWLRHRELRWSSLAIVHRLDRETSGVLVFAKTSLANRSLTEQFAHREVSKRYRLLTRGDAPGELLRDESDIARAGSLYRATRPRAGGDLAVTEFSPCPEDVSSGARAVFAEPLTGRTHQVRVHAAVRGFPVLGDRLYGGAPARRLCLHAEGVWRGMEAFVGLAEVREPRLLLGWLEWLRGGEGRVSSRMCLPHPVRPSGLHRQRRERAYVRQDVVQIRGSRLDEVRDTETCLRRRSDHGVPRRS